MEENKTVETLEFIQLIKSVIEYFGTTKAEENILHDNNTEKSNDNIDDIHKLFNEMDYSMLENVGIQIPNEIDKEIREAFKSQIKYYRKLAENKTKI